MLDKKIPTYQEVEKVLEPANIVASSAELHGLLSGLICVGVVSEVSGEAWAQSILLDSTKQSLTGKEIDILRNLFEITRKKIVKLDIDFQLLLPPDEELLKKRAHELGAWCRGFIIGLNLGGFTEEILCSEDCKEALQRMTEIASIDYSGLEISGEDEEAYNEVMEYVRLAVLMIRAELDRQSVYDDLFHENETIH